MERNITDLPLTILDLIFQKLNLEDKVMLTQVNEDFKNAFCFHCQSEFSQINQIDITTDSFPTFFQISGSKIEYIKMNKFENQEVILVGEDYPDIISINIKYLKGRKSLEKFRNIKILKNPIFMTLTVNFINSIEYIGSLPRLRNLKKLTLESLSDWNDKLKFSNLCKKLL